MDIYSTYAMLQVLPSLRKAPRFFQDTFFPGTILSQGEKVAFDLLPDDLRLAPFVSPVVQGKIMKRKTYQTNEIAPAYVKPKWRLDPSRVIRRQAGEAIGGELSPAEREQLLLAQELQAQRDMVTRRIETMCAELLKTGKVTIVGDEYPRIQLDFQRPAGQTVQLATTATWTTAHIDAKTANPVDDVEGWCDTVATSVGSRVTDVVFGKTAWGLYKYDPKAKDAIDVRFGQVNAMSLGMNPADPGTPVWKGSVGNTNFWLYNDTYEADDGTTAKLIDDNSVILVANGAAVGTQGYGAIMDASNSYKSVPFYPKSWVENDPGARMLMTQSAPIPFFGRIKATMGVLVQ